jgi:hypothetical protein
MVALPAYNREGPQTGLGNVTYSSLLAANVPEQITVPTDDSGLKAK